MNAILETSCGCRRAADIPDGTREWNVPLLNLEPKWLPSGDDLDTTQVGVLCRQFRYIGKQLEHLGTLVPVFVEVGVVRAIATKEICLAPNPADEWKDSVCRVYDWVDRSAGLAVMDAEFVEKHSALGGTIVRTVNGGGRLVGAYYYSPSWQHAAETVATFRRLDELRYTGWGR